MKYKVTIGLEIHAELKTATKMFCGCKNDPFVKDPNIYVCPVCLGLPGTLPVMNKQAVISTLMIGKAMNCAVAAKTKWDRKHYYYPDLPKGYQISQYDQPILTGGEIEINGQIIHLTRIHLEEDTGKLVHEAGSSVSLVDYNRAGVPLVELVSEPEISDGNTARLFAEEYQQILRSLKVASADMEKGEMRVEVNISLAPEGERGTKVEIKNLNSFKSVEKSIDFEIKRQTEILEKGEKIVQETRGWNLDRATTVSQRVKETSADYRYFPEPDLPPVDTTLLQVPDIPLLPSQIRKDLIAKGIREVDADILTRRPELIQKLATIEKQEESVLAQVAQMFINLPITIDKSIDELIELAKMPSHQRKLKLSGEDLGEVLDESVVVDQIESVLKENDSALQEYLAGKQAVYGFLFGQVMKKVSGKVDPAEIHRLLRSSLGQNQKSV